MKIVTVVGARPQFIKAAALSRVISSSHTDIEEILVHTGQHYDSNMSDVFFSEMEIPSPKYHLGIGGCPQGAMTGRMLEAIEKALVEEKPDWVLVYGDTNSTLAGALATKKLLIPLAHVEAGLRSFNRNMSEEINRIVADHCSDLLFTPSRCASFQIEREGIAAGKIRQVGDVMYDAVLHYWEKAKKSSRILEEWNLKSKDYALATIHRAENTDNEANLTEIFLGLCDLSREICILLPLHPRTQQALQRYGLYEEVAQRLQLTPPLGYFDMLQLENHAQVIFTDSGGVQKEAYFFQVPCLTLRGETEWTELVEHGFNRLVPLNRKSILTSYRESRNASLNWSLQLYGNGRAAKQIIHELSLANHGCAY